MISLVSHQISLRWTRCCPLQELGDVECDGVDYHRDDKVARSYLVSKGVAIVIFCQNLTWKRLIFVHKPIFRFEKCPQIYLLPYHMNVEGWLLPC